MHRLRGELRFSPTDLFKFMESPFATWMDRFDLERPGAATPDEPDEGEKLVMKKGLQHEAEVLARLRAERRDVVEIPDGPAAAAATRAAIRDRHEVVFQAALAHGRFRGYADFLVLGDDGAYEVWDAKLARRARPYFIVQLCCYAEMLEALTGRRPARLRVALGSGELATFRTDDFYWFYRNLESAFLAQMDGFDPDARPFPDPGADHGRWTGEAERMFEEADHLCRVANIRSSQIRRLEAAGVGTLTALAESDLAHLPGVGDAVLRTLRRQAALQLASAGADRPRFEVLSPGADEPRRGLALLPPASPLDVYFDMEGYPLVEGGLEYLFGWVEADGAEPEFRDLWAHDAATEKAALEGFLDRVHDRWRRDRDMHVYHYAAYEVTALRRLTGRYGTREDELDALLRHEVFVDLYQVVRQGLLVGEPSYSIKNVEKLYRPKRAGEVTAALESIVAYERWIESGEPADWRESPILASIRDYNRDDCESTFELAEWLRARQAEQGIAFLPPPRAGEVEDEEERPISAENQARRDLMLEILAAIPEEERDGPEATLAWLLEFHRREDKPAWWARFDRATKTAAELAEDPDCLGDLRRTKDPPEPVKRSLRFWYSFDPAQETKLAEGDRGILAGESGASVRIDELDQDEGLACLRLSRRALDQKLGGAMPARLSLLPDDLVNNDLLRAAIHDTVARWRETGELPAPLEALLRRGPPRIAGRAPGPLVAPGADVAAETVRLVRGLDDSLLCVQGPPGSGKTFVGSMAVAALLEDGRSVGVTSNSHRAILNLMRAVNRRMDGRLRCVKAGGPADDPLFEECPGAVRVASGRDAAAAFAGGLIGGSAWLFARPEMAGRLDHLFVDEAGQVSVANLAATARAARNVVLLGDQMQLGQPIQGSHPGESGRSLLDLLLGDHATIPDDLGVFLGTTWRLHPDICGFVSGAVYEDRLSAEPRTANRVVRLPAGGGKLVRKEAGIVFVPVPHEGNSQASEEEAAAIREVAAELIGRERTDGEGRPAGEVGIGDILFVAPYNLQVRTLEATLPAGARVASVDRFQGQEAPIVVVSLCASHDEHGPRGLSFLLDRNRLNVAVSRAQSLAIVVGDPLLAHTRCRTVEDMERVNLLCRLVEAGGRGE